MDTTEQVVKSLVECLILSMNSVEVSAKKKCVVYSDLIGCLSDLGLSDLWDEIEKDDEILRNLLAEMLGQ